MRGGQTEKHRCIIWITNAMIDITGPCWHKVMIELTHHSHPISFSFLFNPLPHASSHSKTKTTFFLILTFYFYSPNTQILHTKQIKGALWWWLKRKTWVWVLAWTSFTIPQNLTLTLTLSISSPLPSKLSLPQVFSRSTQVFVFYF